MGAPSPRYVAEHFLMPRFLRERGPDLVLSAIERRDAEFFIPVWFEAGFRFTPTFLYSLNGALRIGILTFPRPQEPTEAYLGIVVGRVGDPAFLRYFLWEHSVSLDGSPATVIGEWQESRHMNYGPGPAFGGDLVSTAQALTSRILPLVER